MSSCISSLLQRFSGPAWLLVLVVGCGGGGGGSPSTATDPPLPSGALADINLLFMGNSHTLVNDIPGTVTAMVRAARPTQTVAHTVAPGSMFLDERLTDDATLQLLREHRWNFVVLQAQKYSTSGLFEYSTSEAEALVRMSRAAGALPVLFPEWPRQGIVETQRIFDVHASIARHEPACIAPIGQAWDLALARNPGLVLHAPDGNHSAPAGAFLAALVIAATITGTAPDVLPDLPIAGVDEATQAFLRRIAAETVLAFSPRQFCAG